MVPEDNRVFDPELLMTEVIMYTHYMPEEWKAQLHSKKVSLGLFIFGSKFTQYSTRHDSRFIRNLESCSL